jgi:hypothetical protein
VRRKTAGIVFHHDSFTVAAQIHHQLLERAVVQDVVADDAMLQLFVNDAVRGRPDTAVVIVAPYYQVVGGTGNSARALQPDLGGIVSTGPFAFFPLRLMKLPVMLICSPPSQPTRRFPRDRRNCR